MYQEITSSDFCDWFLTSETYKNNFSFRGLKFLYMHLTNLEEDTGEKIEFDPVAICCEYSEYENLEEIKNNYNDIETIEDLRDHTQVIEINNSDRLIIQDF
tara:strand:- start:1140 stop:1442 length:303 start_codon:yes stop_codon:yes gene_type:complete